MIAHVIQPRSFELILARICTILAGEFSSQFLLGGDYDLEDVKVYMERMSPFNVSELPAINVRMERGDWSGHHQGHSDGVYRFAIECNTRGRQDGQQRGDERSKMLVQKIMGLAWAILKDPIYNTLSFPKGQMFGHTHCEMVVFSEPTSQDLEYATMAQLSFVVKAAESTQYIGADTQAVMGDTTVKLFDTERGYYWSTATYEF